LSTSGPPIAAPIAAPNAFELNDVSQLVTSPVLAGKYLALQNVNVAAIAMIDPESM
jgi:hypothetical protein